MKEHQRVALVLCLIWLGTLLYGEMFAFWMPPFFSCSWPHRSNSKMAGQGHAGDYVKVAVIADPQLMDKTSLHLPPKSLALEIAQFYTDLYMRRAIFSSVLPFKPDVVLFLGDYFDGGPNLSDEEWQESLSRFKHIFGLNTAYDNIQVYYIPGNHDLGYANLYSSKPEVIKRYEKEFGSRNYQFKVGKVEFVVVDAQTLDGKQNLASASWDFVMNISKDNQSYPRALLTHIPLYRQDWINCGPHRHSPIIIQWIQRTFPEQEIRYQNYITEEASNRLLNLIKPVLILSGHDHDQCTVTHDTQTGPVMEHTLGTISWQQGNLYPSFMLLSVSNSSLSATSSREDMILTKLCFLPKQTHIYIWYLLLFVLTILALLFWPTGGLNVWHHFGNLVDVSKKLMSCNIFRDGTKEKNEDENCEYEMIWGADGSMHVIKKALSNPVTSPSDRSLVERGNAVMRPAAKKAINLESELSLDVDNHNAVKLAPRASRSKIKIIIQRLLRMIRMVILIAAVNVPLYMMLLFKDWIDK
ncbi:hypothetical protein SLEP1_g36078 [Rubroshorea leprosula]|uniref:Calcineurin-like phosphoesterase domain-containing protein n=1 Tax=Rubroshorea leprosula TaxID=152421 RepID=A0AAV5KQV2_9ROSI|nr:hypothetical protein SLEP1_g36078 [Rubroshorea leprosula]